MASELGWSHARQEQELRNGVRFLTSFGLYGVPEDLFVPHRGWRDWIENRILRLGHEKVPRIVSAYSRSAFEAGEIELIAKAFNERASGMPKMDEEGESQGEKRLPTAMLLEVITVLPGYEDTKKGHLDNVLTEVRIGKKGDVELDEFFEVSTTTRPRN